MHSDKNNAHGIVHKTTPTEKKNAMQSTAQNAASSLDPSQVVSSAIRSVFERWTALRLIVEHQLGGSTREADELLSQTVAMVTTTAKKYDIDDFVDFFYHTFDRLQSDIEDGSPEDVAEVIVRIRDAAARGNLTPALEATTKPRTRAQGFALSVEGGQGANDAGNDQNAMQDISQHRPPSPVADEDGFMEVPSRRRHR